MQTLVKEMSYRFLYVTTSSLWKKSLIANLSSCSQDSKFWKSQNRLVNVFQIPHGASENRHTGCTWKNLQSYITEYLYLVSQSGYEYRYVNASIETIWLRSWLLRLRIVCESLTAVIRPLICCAGLVFDLLITFNRKNDDYIAVDLA